MQNFLERYIRERQVSAKHVALMRRSIALFSETLGHSPLLGDLTDDAVNGHLLRLERGGYSPSSVKGERARLLALWRAAFECGELDLPPRRIRKIRVVLPAPVALTVDEARRLLATAAQMSGRFKCGVAYADFLRAWILLGWETGLRFSDMLALPLASIRHDGAFVAIQQKSQKPVQHHLSADALAALRHLQRQGLSRLGDATNWHCVYVLVRRLFAEAEVAGSSKRLRQSSGTWVEHGRPGFGHLHLGHGRDVFERHYNDPLVSGGVERPKPPRIA